MRSTVRQLRFDFGKKPLFSSISFQLDSGSFSTIVGLSGCGKTTLLKALSGRIQPTSGQISLAGHPVQTLIHSLPLAIGYLPQHVAFHGELSAREILGNAARLRLPISVSTNQRDQWVDNIIELSRLRLQLDQPYSTLSGGQKRRVALAEELIGDPPFLFLDELTSGLDEFSDREMMLWLHDLAHIHGKTVVLVTHATYHLDISDSVLFLHKGRQVFFGPYPDLLSTNGVNSVADLFEIYQTQDPEIPDPPPLEQRPPETQQPLKTASPPGGCVQFPTLLKRQATLFWRDRGQLWLHLILAVTFPALVAVFAYQGLPQVRQLTLALESNIVITLAEQLLYLKESFHAASLVSGLAMFQVVLLTLIGANNGAREVAKEHDVLVKELRVGLSPAAYVTTKFFQVVFLCLVQAFWMAWFVKTVCGFPGSMWAQFGILFSTILAMSTTCLAISAFCKTPERASLLAIYLVGFQLPLSGAALALPEWLSLICRPFIAAYWGWSGYLKTFEDTRHYDIVKQSTQTFIAPYGTCLAVLGLHVIVSLFLAWIFVGKNRGTIDDDVFNHR